MLPAISFIVATILPIAKTLATDLGGIPALLRVVAFGPWIYQLWFVLYYGHPFVPNHFEAWLIHLFAHTWLAYAYNLLRLTLLIRDIAVCVIPGLEGVLTKVNL